MGENGAMRLLGPHQFTLDNAGRLTIPSKMRSWFSEKSLIISLSRDKRYLALYPLSTWAIVAERIRSLAQTRLQADRIRLRLGKNSEECKVDGTWRVLIPEKWRRTVGIEREVILVGAVDKLTAWNPQTWVEEEQQLDEDAELDALEEQFPV
jgi:MraZ protein